ncbi:MULTISPECIES: type II toxin-antitoxin system VapC family toxin [Candidatus Microthrix]|jgi:predicted nucleic acid-binding protein|uniref:Ribonuclease VapC n=1 Tax=Candidatus Neomicrothrix parvicella RN1 TaxID=1229780 RepID=R4Z614_9ACTN|nr:MULTISPECIES: PIN domain-containing protein [Microthrix]MBK6502922.1 PIN domain-containing protein [Candidatus Microthrix sp.]MBK7021273.1 PIN domain-containing protein [Candidatus Microthrix sp.]MBL0204926.1 PIN domain-containing protein [Candidatus Microthrix sp.]MBP7405170.1 PIN domain-containing protein [Candidatus Microthrix sp.]MBP7878198.1 PIN domain-containing protein [Candidatus Microthrix sp.]
MKFADTSWWVAWALPDDRNHADALGAMSHLGANEQVLTTNLVAGETWTFLRRRAGHQGAFAWLERHELLQSEGRLRVHRVTADQESQAWKWLRRRRDRELSFVDATSFEVMRDRRLREALAFDHDFASAGFVELRP